MVKIVKKLELEQVVVKDSSCDFAPEGLQCKDV